MFERICSWENLLSAARKATRGKSGRANVAAFAYRLEDELLDIQNALRSKSYRPGGYVSFVVHEPKRRLISAAPFRDRVVHHALCNVMEPLFECSFIGDSYANRLGKGTHKALDRCQQFARRFAYILQCDIEQFFPAVDHDILRLELFRRIDDPNVRWLVERILDGGAGLLEAQYRMKWFPGDDLFSLLRPRGLPIGNLTSQFWANCYLNPFDHFVKRELRCRAYLRYVDDFMLLSDSKQELLDWKTALVERLAHFRLTIHSGAHPRPVSEGVPFLGFIVFPRRRRLKRRKALHFRRKLLRKAAACTAGGTPIQEVTACVQGWVNHARFGNTVGLRKAVLRGVVVRPWKGKSRKSY